MSRLGAGLARAATVAVALAGLSGSAGAHLVQTGFGAFYDGVVHLVITPADVLVVVALGLYAGQRGKRAARALLLVLPGAWLLGGLVGTWFPGASELPLASAASVTLAGVLLATSAPLPHAATIALGALAGALHGAIGGAIDGTTMTTGGWDVLGRLGAAATVFAAVALLSAAVVSLRGTGPRIAVRVAGSWIGAVGLLMLGWLARPGG